MILMGQTNDGNSSDASFFFITKSSAETSRRLISKRQRRAVKVEKSWVALGVG